MVRHHVCLPTLPGLIHTSAATVAMQLVLTGCALWVVRYRANDRLPVGWLTPTCGWLLRCCTLLPNMHAGPHRIAFNYSSVLCMISSTFKLYRLYDDVTGSPTH